MQKVDMYIHIHIHKHIRMCIYIYTYTYVYIYIYIHIHICLCVYMQVTTIENIAARLNRRKHEQQLVELDTAIFFRVQGFRVLGF